MAKGVQTALCFCDMLSDSGGVGVEGKLKIFCNCISLKNSKTTQYIFKKIYVFIVFFLSETGRENDRGIEKYQ